MAENMIEKKYGRKAFFYVLVTVILLSATSLLQLINANSADSYYYFAVFLSLGLGVLHALLVYRYFPQFSRSEFGKGLLITLIIMILAAVLAAVAYYFLRADYFFLTGLFFFAIPYFSWCAYYFFLQIPPSVYKPWYYPLNQEMPDLDMIDLSQIEVVQFVFNKKPGDSLQTNFTSKAPLNMGLGQLFFIFINDYNEKNSQNTIEYLKDRDNPYGWLFYRKKKWFGRRFYFDPELSFRENVIQPNEFIYALRVS